MKFFERSILCVFAAFALLAVHQIFVRLFETHSWKPMSSSDWAAWVQAVGSIAAIWIAMQQFTKQRVRELTDRRRARIRQLRDQQKIRAQARASYLLAAILWGAQGRRTLRGYMSLKANSQRQPKIIGAYAELLRQTLSEFRSISFDGIAAEDARILTKATVMLSDVEMMFSLRAQFDELEGPPIDLAHYLQIYTAEMQKLFDEYHKLTGEHAIPGASLETPGG